MNTFLINNQLLPPEWSGETRGHQFGGLLKLDQLSYQQLKGGRGLADHAEATIILTVLHQHQVLGEVHAGVLPLNRANLVAAGPLLEAERHVIVVPLGPRVHCCFLYAVSDWIFDSSSVLEMSGVIINWLFTLSIFKTQ